MDLTATDAWLAEYSLVQGCFHVETPQEAVKANRPFVVGRVPGGYLPFAVCDSMDEANRACDDMQALQERCCAEASAAQEYPTEEEATRIMEQSQRLEAATAILLGGRRP